ILYLSLSVSLIVITSSKLNISPISFFYMVICLNGLCLLFFLFCWWLIPYQWKNNNRYNNHDKNIRPYRENRSLLYHSLTSSFLLLAGKPLTPPYTLSFVIL